MKTISSLFALTLLLLTAAPQAEWVWAPEQPLGSTLPNFTTLDSTSKQRELNSLRGGNGIVLLFNRSTVW